MEIFLKFQFLGNLDNNDNEFEINCFRVNTRQWLNVNFVINTTGYLK